MSRPEGMEKDFTVETSSDGSPLSRQVTVSMSAEQYERMFFQPSAPKRGDFAKRFANPTLLGLICFLIPYTSTMFILCGFNGATPPSSLVGLSGDYFMIGGIGMTLAGIFEFILGNTFPCAVFIIFGTHWAALAYQQVPTSATVSAFIVPGSVTAAEAAAGAPYNSSQAFHNVTMCIVCVMLFIGTLRINVLFNLLFIGLIFLFAFIAAADFAVPNASTAADLEHIAMLLRVAGGFGFLGLICGWYLVIVVVCEAVGLPCPLPVFDLSTRVFPEKDRKKEV